MAKTKKYWMLTSSKPAKVNPTDIEKAMISNAFVELIDKFKKDFISKEPNKEYNYLIDIYSSWLRNNFYICEKYKSEFPERIADEFESKLIRLEYVAKNCFNFSYFRHTGKWHLVATSLTLDECKDMILSNPVFQPIG